MSSRPRPLPPFHRSSLFSAIWGGWDGLAVGEGKGRGCETAAASSDAIVSQSSKKQTATMATKTMITTFESAGAKLRFGHMPPADLGMLDAAVDEIEGQLEAKPPIELYGKVCHQQRDVGFFADPEVTYGYFYSGTVAKSQSPGPAIAALLAYVNAEFGAEFNGVLVNQYHGGAEYISDHSDSEAGLDPNTGVIAISAGATRTMRFKRAKAAPVGTPNFKYGAYKIALENGSIVHMAGPQFQQSFTHGIPADARATGSRVSFTFRKHSGEGEAKRIASAEKTRARIAEKTAAAAEEPAAKRAKTE